MELVELVKDNGFTVEECFNVLKGAGGEVVVAVDLLSQKKPERRKAASLKESTAASYCGRPSERDWGKAPCSSWAWWHGQGYRKGPRTGAHPRWSAWAGS